MQGYPTATAPMQRRLPRTPPTCRRRRPTPKATSSSGAWKDALKRDCILRAREKRQALVRSFRKQNSPLISTPGSPMATAREVVEQELRVSGVKLSTLSPLISRDFMMIDGMTGNTSRQILFEKHMIDEEELLQLMHEVEEELQRDEERLGDEAMEIERRDEEHRYGFEQQIADFEAWEESVNNDDKVVERNPCHHNFSS
eukprot:111826_1